MWALDNNNTFSLTTSEGERVLNSNGQPITLSQSNYVPNRVEVLSDGTIAYPDARNNPVAINGQKIGLYQFQNPAGLEKVGETSFAVTDASGQAINEATSNAVVKSTVHQGYLEGSNVQVADEMVNLIVAQRAYEMNSKAITTSDEMLQQANNLKR